MMKKYFLFLIGGLCLFSCTQPRWEVLSPGKKIKICLFFNGEKQLMYNVSFEGREVIHSSPLGIALRQDSQNFIRHLIPVEKKFTVINETYTLTTGKKRKCLNHAHELALTFENKQHARATFIFRAYDDGIAFRYQLYNSRKDTVREEISSFVLDSCTEGWMEQYRSDYEVFYPHRRLDTLAMKDAFICPALFRTPSAHWLLASDAAVYGNYAAMHLRHEGKGQMRFSLPNQIQPGSPWYRGTWEEITMKEDTLVEASPCLLTPWRMLIIGNHLSTIVESVLTENLNPPCELHDTSWIKPGVACFPWWSDDLANDKPDRLKQFIDMAAIMHWQYLEFDIGLIGNRGGYAIDQWRKVAYIPEIIRYAKSKGIEVYGWDERKNLDTPEKRADIFGRYKALGVAGIKIDFLNSDKQEANQFREDALRDAARYRLLVSFHGEITPKGLRRRFPHLMTQEGVRGGEYYKFAPDGEIPDPEHNCTLPFTRNVVGPMDYTPVGFSTPRRRTTYCHELALPVIFESGWMCMADAPEEFLRSPAREYLQSLTSVWDDTRFVSGYPGQYIVLARRKGNDWYVAGINAGQQRWAMMNLNFLKKGEYRVRCYHDPSWTSVSEAGKDKVIADSITVNSIYPQYFPMATNGGFVFIVKNSY